ncbi:hypothetical protein L249_7019, partial [Ophiocordyceps polyrhachis-furcata BCC 54312]
MMSPATRYNPPKQRTRRLAWGPCKSLGCCVEERRGGGAVVRDTLNRPSGGTRNAVPTTACRAHLSGLVSCWFKEKRMVIHTTPKLGRRSRRIIHPPPFPLLNQQRSPGKGAGSLSRLPYYLYLYGLKALLSAGPLVVLQQQWPSCVSSVVVLARALHAGKSGQRLNLQADGSTPTEAEVRVAAACRERFHREGKASGNFWVVRSTRELRVPAGLINSAPAVMLLHWLSIDAALHQGAFPIEHFPRFYALDPASNRVHQYALGS